MIPALVFGDNLRFSRQAAPARRGRRRRTARPPLLPGSAFSLLPHPDCRDVSMTEFRKLMVANRGEIAIRVFRSAHELGIRTVAIYSHEDRFAMHRLKADEAYQVGKAGEPIRSYLDIDGIIALAREKGVDAIHPGYGFLSENAAFARACDAAGIAFVGPRAELLELLGDKVTARRAAEEAGAPILKGSPEPVEPGPEAHALAESLGYPVIVKA